MFSQNDLVREHQCSPVTMNKWMKALCKSGCLEPHKKKRQLPRDRNRAGSNRQNA